MSVRTVLQAFPYGCFVISTYALDQSQATEKQVVGHIERECLHRERIQEPTPRVLAAEMEDSHSDFLQAQGTDSLAMYSKIY